MRPAATILMLLAMTPDANAFIASTDCKFGSRIGGCTTTAFSPMDADSRIIHAEPIIDAPREAGWIAVRRPTFRSDNARREYRIDAGKNVGAPS